MTDDQVERIVRELRGIKQVLWAAFLTAAGLFLGVRLIGAAVGPPRPLPFSRRSEFCAFISGESMVQKLIAWAVANPLIVLILTAALALGGGYAFVHVNIEAYPDPAPAIIEVVAQFPGASAEEVERQVTIPLEVALAGMPGLETTRSKSLFGLATSATSSTTAATTTQAKQDVLNRLATVNLPPGVNPQISPASPIGEILRYTLENPRDPATGKPSTPSTTSRPCRTT